MHNNLHNIQVKGGLLTWNYLTYKVMSTGEIFSENQYYFILFKNKHIFEKNLYYSLFGNNFQ